MRTPINTTEKLRGFLELPMGWHFGEGGPASIDLVGRAIELERRARQLGFDTDAFPGTGEAFCLVLYRGGESHEIVFSNKGVEFESGASNANAS